MIKLKTVKLPKKKGAYYVKVTKLTSKTTGAYIWEHIHIKNHKEGNRMKKMKSRSFRILMAAVISAAMLCPQVKISAADGLSIKSKLHHISELKQ